MAYPTHQEIHDELTLDPEGLGYVGKTNQEQTDLLNGATQEDLRPEIAPFDLFRRFDRTEYLGLAAAPRTLVNALLTCQIIDPNDASVIGTIDDTFGDPSATRRNFIGHASGAFPGDDLRKKAASRAFVLWEVNRIKRGDVDAALLL